MEEDSSRYWELVIAHVGDISNIYCRTIEYRRWSKKTENFHLLVD